MQTPSKPSVGGELELVQVVVVGLVAELRVVELGGDVDVDAVVALAEVVRQVGVRHEVEGMDFHKRLLSQTDMYGRRRKYYHSPPLWRALTSVLWRMSSV